MGRHSLASQTFLSDSADSTPPCKQCQIGFRNVDPGRGTLTIQPAACNSVLNGKWFCPSWNFNWLVRQLFFHWRTSCLHSVKSGFIDPDGSGNSCIKLSTLCGDNGKYFILISSAFPNFALRSELKRAWCTPVMYGGSHRGRIIKYSAHSLRPQTFTWALPELSWHGWSI